MKSYYKFASLPDFIKWLASSAVFFDIQPANGEANIPSLVLEKHDVTSIRTKEEEKPENFVMYLCLHVCMCVVQIIPLSYVIVLLC